MQLGFQLGSSRLSSPPYTICHIMRLNLNQLNAVSFYIYINSQSFKMYPSFQPTSKPFEHICLKIKVIDSRVFKCNGHTDVCPCKILQMLWKNFKFVCKSPTNLWFFTKFIILLIFFSSLVFAAIFWENFTKTMFRPRIKFNI